MHEVLPWHERMVIIAEYPQKNSLFKDMTAAERLAAARRWTGGFATYSWKVRHELLAKWDRNQYWQDSCVLGKRTLRIAGFFAFMRGRQLLVQLQSTLHDWNK